MNAELKNAIKIASSSKQFPDEEPYLSLSFKSAVHLADTFDLSIQQVEIVALENDIIPEHYARNPWQGSDQIPRQ